MKCAFHKKERYWYMHVTCLDLPSFEWDAFGVFGQYKLKLMKKGFVEY